MKNWSFSSEGRESVIEISWFTIMTGGRESYFTVGKGLSRMAEVVLGAWIMWKFFP